MRAAIAELFKELAHELAPGVASVTSAEVPRAGTIIALKPANPAATSIEILCDEFDVYGVYVGSESYWEFPYERRYKQNEKDVLKEIEEMSRAVIEGRCEEERHWFSLTGRIRVGDDYTYSMTNMPKLPIPPFFTRRYASYADATRHHAVIGQ